ncbi:phage tail assembly protein [Erwinia aphidicola]|uniref:phage tail assembly protein n=1 Tax=Erwinia aphidicola TaxID=68334 RepID=UPI003CF90E3F
MEQKENVVVLVSPVKRGETEIGQVELIKPNAGALRGVRLSDLAGSDVDALLTVLPRISQPALTKAECLNLAPEDLISMAGTVIGFLSPKSDE